MVPKLGMKSGALDSKPIWISAKPPNSVVWLYNIDVCIIYSLTACLIYAVTDLIGTFYIRRAQ